MLDLMNEDGMESEVLNLSWMGIERGPSSKVDEGVIPRFGLVLL